MKTMNNYLSVWTPMLWLYGLIGIGVTLNIAQAGDPWALAAGATAIICLGAAWWGETHV
jgi:hypothetical protein